MKKYIIFALLILIKFNLNAQCDNKLTNFISSGSGQSSTTYAFSNAFDGKLNTKWSDNSTVKYLDVIFDEPVEICKVVIYHAQAGGESASLNTSDYRILSYREGAWINQLTVTQNTAGTTTHEFTPFTTTVLRLQIDKAAQSANDMARIYEFEVYGEPVETTEEPVYLKRIYPLQVTGSGQVNSSQSMNMAFDGDYGTKWCSNQSGSKWLDMTFKEPVKVEKMIVHHAGEGENTPKWNTKAFKLQAYVDGNYQDIISVTDNTLDVSTHTCTGDISTDKMRFLVSQGEQNANTAARIYEIELYAKYEPAITPAATVEAGNVYEIFPYQSDKVLSVENSSRAGNAVIRTYTRSNVNSQRWRAINSGGKLAFQNVYSGYYLSSSGSGIIQLIGTNATTQWTLVPVEGEDDCYYVTNIAGRYLRMSADIEGFPVTFMAKSDNPYEKGEIWKFVKSEDIPNTFTAEMRDEMMNNWKEKFYLPATFNPTFTSGSATPVGYVLECPGFWSAAENMEILLDAYETTKNDEYRVMYNEVFDNFKATQGNWQNNNFNDDLAWLILGMVRAHLLFGDQSRNYEALAKQYFDFVYSRALLSNGECMAGLLRWQQGVRSTNSCVNGPMEVAACYMAIATGDDSYYTKAKNIYQLQRQYLTNLPTGGGQVYDSWNCNNNTYNQWSSTYNQGTFLGAAVMLYQRYGDTDNGTPTTYKSDAQKVMDFSMGSYFCDNNGIIKVCTSGADLIGFKGILMRYVRKYFEEIQGIDVDKYKNWMMKNALHAYNNRNSQGVTWTDWLRRADEANYYPYMDNGNLTHQIFGAFGTGTAVSAAVNIPFDTEENKINKVEKQSHVSSVLVGKHLFINSTLDEPLQKVDIFNVQGIKLFSLSNINTSNTDFDLQGIDTSVIIVKVQTKLYAEAIKLLIK